MKNVELDDLSNLWYSKALFDLVFIVKHRNPCLCIYVYVRVRVCVCVYVYVCMCICVYVCMWVYMFILRLWIARNVKLTELYIFQSDVVPRKFLEHFATVVNVAVGSACVVCWLKSKKHKVKPHKIRTSCPLNSTKHSAHQALHFSLWQRPSKVSRLIFRFHQSSKLERGCVTKKYMKKRSRWRV